MALPPLSPALDALADLARSFPEVDGHVVWQDETGFHRQEAEELGLDPEEIAFYAEGLLTEGFHLRWALLAEVEAPGDPLILELTCREGTPPDAPPLPDGWQIARPGPSRPSRAAPLAEGRASPPTPTPARPGDAAEVYAALHRACASLGCLLFTITVQSADGTLAARRYTSHPVEYPVSGTKPVTRDAWYDQVIRDKKSFVANTPAEFEKLFFDHALITSLGLGSALNIPVVDDGRVLGTVNVLAEAGHFTLERRDAYHALTAAAQGGLARAMTASAE